MTVAEFLSRVSSREISEWMAVYRIRAEERKAAEKKERGS